MKSQSHIKRTIEQFVGANTTICDNCRKEVCDNGEMLIGGSYNGGFYHVGRVPRSTSLNELRRDNNWDFCSLKCLKVWLDNEVAKGEI